jgi:hypothetical protein
MIFSQQPINWVKSCEQIGVSSYFKTPIYKSSEGQICSHYELRMRNFLAHIGQQYDTMSFKKGCFFLSYCNYLVANGWDEQKIYGLLTSYHLYVSHKLTTETMDQLIKKGIFIKSGSYLNLDIKKLQSFLAETRIKTGDFIAKYANKKNTKMHFVLFLKRDRYVMIDSGRRQEWKKAEMLLDYIPKYYGDYSLKDKFYLFKPVNKGFSINLRTVSFG